MSPRNSGHRLKPALVSGALHVSLATSLRQLGLQAQAVLSPPRSMSPPPTSASAEQVVVAAEQGEGLEALDRARPRIQEALRAAGPGAKVAFEWKVTREKQG